MGDVICAAAELSAEPAVTRVPEVAGTAGI
jgi:hypothetical protein